MNLNNRLKSWVHFKSLICRAYFFFLPVHLSVFLVYLYDIIFYCVQFARLRRCIGQYQTQSNSWRLCLLTDLLRNICYTFLLKSLSRHVYGECYPILAYYLSNFLLESHHILGGTETASQLENHIPICGFFHFIYG